MNKELLYADDLAEEMGRGRVYIYAMKRAGFEMHGGTATLAEAKQWLREHPNFKSTDYCKKKNSRGQPKKRNPDSDTAKEILYRDGEMISGQLDLALFDQAMLDSNRLFVNLDAQGIPSEIGDELLSDSEPHLGQIVMRKLILKDVDFFKALAVLVERRAQSAEPVDKFRLEMVRLKRRATLNGEKHSYATLFDLLAASKATGLIEYVPSERKIRRTAKEIKYPLS